MSCLFYDCIITLKNNQKLVFDVRDRTKQSITDNIIKTLEDKTNIENSGLCYIKDLDIFLDLKNISLIEFKPSKAHGY